MCENRTIITSFLKDDHHSTGQSHKPCDGTTSTVLPPDVSVTMCKAKPCAAMSAESFNTTNLIRTAQSEKFEYEKLFAQAAAKSCKSIVTQAPIAETP